LKTFGKLSFEDGKWRIDAEPDVLLRCKRVFARMDKNQHDHVTLADSIDTARDIEWFLERYPLEFDPPAIENRLKKGANKQREREAMVDVILTRTSEPRDFDLAEPARDYQRAAAELALVSGGLLLCDEMGTGKTISAIAMLTDAKTRPALVVCPKALQRQWQRQLKRFAPGMTTHILKVTKPYVLGQVKTRKRKGKNQDEQDQPALPGVNTFPDVIISTYAKLPGWASTLGKCVNSVVYDEIQEFRHGEDTEKGRAGKHITSKTKYRLGLTGTPIYNYGDEMFNVIQFVRPGALGERAEYNREWCNGLSTKVEEPKALGTFLRKSGIMLRRTREDVGREMPKISRVFHDIDSDADVIDNVEEAATALARTVLSAGKEAFAGERLQASGELSYLLRQATGVAKAPHVADFVRMIVEGGEPVVLFGWHHEVYSIWQERLADFNPVMVTGKQSDKQKDDAIQAFARGESKVIIISLRSAPGLDGLQQASCTVVHGELDPAFGVHEQCDFRLDREGQTKPVISYYLLAPDGSDPILGDMLRRKGEQLVGIRDPDEEFFEKLETDDVERAKSLAEAFLNRRARSKEVA
jgi:SNF2 family DNA or RNA helicase